MNRRWPLLRRRVLATVGTLVLVLCRSPGGGAGEDAPRRAQEEISRILRERPPTPESLALLQERSYSLRTSISLRNAVAEATGAEMLNVLEYVVALGELPSDAWRFLRGWMRVDACVKAQFVARKPRPNDQLIPLEHEAEVVISEVYVGQILLRPENTPVCVTVRTGGGMPIPWFEREFIGKAIVACVSTDAHGLVCEEWWAPTGRERATLSRVAPLQCRDPRQLLEYLRSEDRGMRWLSAAQVVMACRGLDQSRILKREASRYWLKADRLSRLHAQIQAEFEELAPRVVWSTVLDGFVTD